MRLQVYSARGCGAGLAVAPSGQTRQIRWKLRAKEATREQDLANLDDAGDAQPTTQGTQYRKARTSGLNHLRHLRTLLVDLKRAYFRRIWGMDIHPTAQFSLSAKFDRTYPKGVHLGAHSYTAFDVRILTHDRTRGLYLHTRIGENCFIGGRSLILPGVEIGNNCIVGAGSVVTRSVPPRSIVAGNPARVLKSDIDVVEYGRLASADATESALVEQGDI